MRAGDLDFHSFDDDPPLCLSADLHNTAYRSSHILCHKPKGHGGDHGNERFAWPAASPSDPERAT